MSTAAVRLSGVRTPSLRQRPILRFMIWTAEACAASCAMVGEMSILDHLDELRRRLIRSLIAIAAGMVVCWTYIVALIDFLKAPARAAGIRIVAIEPTEIFSLYFKVAIAGGVCLAA